jgi:lipopolysaccharide heptosyltransferase II
MPTREIDWRSVRRVLVVRLRSIGDTVLCTPSLIALKRFLSEARVDILLEDWVAPILDGFESVDTVLTVTPSAASRFAVAKNIRKRKYDVVLNLHGGTTATFFVATSGSRHRVGYRNYQYSFLYNHLLSSPSDFWKRDATHSAEQQLALLGFIDVPVEDRPKSRLAVTESSMASLEAKLSVQFSLDQPFAIIHPLAASITKEWQLDKYARTAEFLSDKGLAVTAVGTSHDSAVLDELQSLSQVPIHQLTNLTLPELTAYASKANLFVGNDSGVAHIAAAVKTPSVVVFGSSNRDHWSPWTDGPNEVVYEKFACQPCPGRECKEFGDPKCILTIPVENVFDAIDRVLSHSMIGQSRVGR